MTENFAQLFEESLKEIETRPGSIIKGTVVKIEKDNVIVDAGLKSESVISIDQFKNSAGEVELKLVLKLT
jgi:small subunit ribosomal protein S1